MTAGKPSARSERTDTNPARSTNSFDWTPESEESLAVLKLGGTLGIFFLLAYCFYNFHLAGGLPQGAILYWIALSGMCAFFGLTWTRAFRRYWKMWTMLFCIFIMQIFVLISAVNADPESRFIAMILIPLCTASFVSWGTRWQFVMGLVCLLSYFLATTYVPIEGAHRVYRWFGLLAAVAFAQCTAVFIERYRQRLHRQVEELNEAARFRENTIATMAHDIRSPVAALGGYAHLLEEEGLTAKDRSDLLSRIAATAWSMDLVVSNLLDFYQIQEHHLAPSCVEVNPGVLIADALDECAAQARRRRLRIRSEIVPMPQCVLDPRLVDRIVKNIVAHAMTRMTSGEVHVRTGTREASIVIEISDSGPAILPGEIEAMFLPPDRDGMSGKTGALGLFVARAMAQASGGKIDARYSAGRGLSLIAELPIAAQASSQVLN